MTNMYDKAACVRLSDKTEYELWLLKFLSGSEDQPEIDMVLSNRDPRAHVYLRTGDTVTLGLGRALDVMDRMSPLVFTAAYKMLDMIFEWMLEENFDAGAISANKPPSWWSFERKAEQIQTLPHGSFPPLMQSAPHFRERLVALYVRLLGYRNEIVHRNSFRVHDGKLEVTHEAKGSVEVLELGRGELGALVRLGVETVLLLVGSAPFGTEATKRLGYHFDQIEKLHGLGRLGQRKPLLLNVRLNVAEERGAFPADLGTVRRRVIQTHPDADVLLGLTVIGLVGGKPSIAWRFPVDSVPSGDEFVLHATATKSTSCQSQMSGETEA